MLRWLKGKNAGKTPPVRSDEIQVDERALELVNLGDKMYATEDYKGAFEAYDSALRVDGHCAEAWYRRGRYFKRQDRILQAATCYVRALELKPQMAEAWNGLGETILAFIKADTEPLFIRENRAELLSEALDAFNKAIMLGGNSPKAQEGRKECIELLKGDPVKVPTPPIFSFHSGGILENAKREVVAPYLKPGDYRRKTPPQIQND
jgi:tetratricopeptide (TPR) repeat protein